MANCREKSLTPKERRLLAQAKASSEEVVRQAFKVSRKELDRLQAISSSRHREVILELAKGGRSNTEISAITQLSAALVRSFKGG